MGKEPELVQALRRRIEAQRSRDNANRVPDEDRKYPVRKAELDAVRDFYGIETIGGYELYVESFVREEPLPLRANSLETELYREYDIPGRRDPYRIDNPQTLYLGGSTHRVLDKDGVIHCIPFPGNGTVLRWKSRPEASPVAF